MYLHTYLVFQTKIYFCTDIIRDSFRCQRSTKPIYYRDVANILLIFSIVGGTTGEAMSLSIEERKAVLEAWIKAARPNGTKVIAQIGGAPLPDVRELVI